MHTWGDSWFEKYGDDLGRAISRIRHIARRYGRIGLHGKEKYGTFRDDGIPWDGTLHGLIYPGYVFINQQKWYYNIDYPILRPLMRYTGIQWLVLKWQKLVWNYVMQSTVRRYPHLERELTVMIDRYEWITPGIFGPLDGTLIHLSYWRCVGDISGIRQPLTSLEEWSNQ